MKKESYDKYKKTKPRNHEIRTGVMVHENKKRKQEQRDIREQLKNDYE